MRRKNPLIDSYYSKSKQYPPVRYSRYWQVSYQITEIALMLYQVGIKESKIIRFLQVVNPNITRDRFREFVRAMRKYEECRYSKTLITQVSSKRPSRYRDFRSKKPPKFGGS